MIIVNAKFYIKEDKKSQFLKEIEGLISASKKDEGCLEYSLYESTNNQLEFVMIENWESQEAIEKHNTNPLLLAFAKNLSTYSSKKPVLQIAETK
ncbi:antibiotic biosynthesis monooxygenase [Lactococcus lactis]|uniref:putative quinol monooxygenase n=1 Tax=Lactococcus lactis TaxID=1358 RepID=UPI002415B8C9|nr:putative quinol monooxygenase [Lactococcus lactis]MDG4987103.1 antibiotic biosynthesis monooxygenase [Lactococcus lactis]